MDAALDDLSRFLQVIGSDTTLKKLFCQLAALSPVQRQNEIHLMAERMDAANKDRELVRVFTLFADARVFEAAMAALRECGYIKP